MEQKFKIVQELKEGKTKGQVQETWKLTKSLVFKIWREREEIEKRFNDEQVSAISVQPVRKAEYDRIVKMGRAR